jgi:hypothetical protein
VWCVVLMEELDVIKTQALQATWIKVQSSILRCVIVALILLCVCGVLLWVAMKWYVVCGVDGGA